MREQINEKVICVLRKNIQTNKMIIDYVKIDKPLTNLINNFIALCENHNTTLEQVINFINTNEEVNQLNAHYRYCNSLKGSYQAFNANNQDIIKDIIQQQQLIISNKENNPREYDVEKAVSEFKQRIIKRYVLWNDAFSINKTYRLCHEDKSILTFSHRIDGWSNPVYQLTANFSVELKTNFGYGHASYFYTKLKYKDIEITPFSDWINYEIAEFSEIIRYTQSYLLENGNWLDAMEFSKEACNLSLQNEVAFVEKYIIEECEKMVSGLEEIFDIDHFSFKNRNNTEYTKDKKGHVLVEFRGEKISGALDFISKILEYDKIASIRSFIKRIEICNKKIQPILVDESKAIKMNITNLKILISELKPKYDKIIAANISYETKKNELKNLMIEDGEIDVKRLDSIFNYNYPEYNEFQKEYKSTTESYRIMNEQLNNLTQVYNNIISYTVKIINYFG